MRKARFQEQEERPRTRRKRGRLLRFFRGYLMTVGALTTFYVLLRIIVWILVEAAKVV